MTIEIVIGVTASYHVVCQSTCQINEQNKKISANCTSREVTSRAGDFIMYIIIFYYFFLFVNSEQSYYEVKLPSKNFIFYKTQMRKFIHLKSPGFSEITLRLEGRFNI